MLRYLPLDGMATLYGAGDLCTSRDVALTKVQPMTPSLYRSVVGQPGARKGLDTEIFEKAASTVALDDGSVPDEVPYPKLCGGFCECDDLNSASVDLCAELKALLAAFVKRECKRLRPQHRIVLYILELYETPADRRCDIQ